MSWIQRNYRNFFDPASIPPPVETGGEGYGGYPWWQPFFTWRPAEQIALPDVSDLPRRYVCRTAPMPIIIMGGATYRFERGPLPRRTRPIVESVAVQPTTLVDGIAPRPLLPPRPPRRILTEVMAIVDRVREQQLREDDELVLIIPEQHG